MEPVPPFYVAVDDLRFPGKFVVTVQEEGCRTLQWPFHRRLDAERKAEAELGRLTEQFAVS